MNMVIQSLLQEHYPAVREIYEQGIATGNATFQTEAPTWEAWNKSHLSSCRIVAIACAFVIGWAALTPVSDRCVYEGVAEVSVYVRESHKGKGVGKLLLSALISQSEEQNVWTLQAGIFPENASSIRRKPRLS